MKRISVKFVAEMLDVERATVYSWIQSGRLKARRHGAMPHSPYAIDPDSLAELKAQMGIDQTGEA